MASFLSLALLGFVASVPAAPRISGGYTVASWTMDDGLPHNLIHAVAQGADGLIWVGTWEGVARFNGREFTTFDRQNTPGMELTAVFSILRDDDGGLWVGSQGSLYRMERDGQLREMGSGRDLPVARIETLLQHDDGTLLIGNAQGVFRLPVGDARVGDASVEAWGHARGMGTTGVRRLARDQEGGLLVAGDDGVWWWRKDGSLKRLHAGERVDAVVQDRRGVVWMNLSHGQLVSYRPGEDIDEPVAVDQISAALMVDDEGLLWAGSANGLHRIAEGAAYGITTADGLGSDYTRSVLQAADGTIWVGHASGLNRWKNGVITTVPLALSDGVEPSVLALAAANDGGVWVGTYDQGATHVAPDGRVVDRVTVEEGLPASMIRSLLQDPDGGLWVGMVAGLAHVHDGQVRLYGAEDNLPPAIVMALYRDHDGVLWIGTSQAGIAAMQVDGSIVRWSPESGFPAQIGFDFLHDAAGDLWIASDRGLLRMRGGRFHVYNHAHGLPRDQLFRIIDDGYGQFWLSSNQGVFRIARSGFDDIDSGRREQLAVELVNRSDGMPSSQNNGASWPAGWLLDNGALMFPTAAGLAVIDPDLAGGRARRELPVVIERFAVNGIPQSVRSGYRVGADAGRIVIAYVGLNFRAPDNVRYRYRMHGFDREWVDAGSAVEANYTNLPAGDYRFEVQAMAMPVDWSSRQGVGSATIALEVAPPWWLRPGVIIAAVLATLALLALAYVGRTAHYRRRQHQLNRIITVRTGELRSKNLALEAADREREELVRRLAHQASHDTLTGLPNRRAADEYLLRELAVAADASAPSPLCVALMDLDHFKRINDEHGHAVGDEVLRRVGDVLRESLGESAFVARHGGEEFLLVLPGVEPEPARTHLETVRRQIAAIRVAGSDGQAIGCTASFGLVYLGEHLKTRRELLAAADRALYQAKHEGRDRIVG
ncbi:MAG TPA: diguanylate cyclase [Lysobacter sp.]|nr:diguanylate cyclase [Lysobacter sp.]